MTRATANPKKQTNIRALQHKKVPKMTNFLKYQIIRYKFAECFLSFRQVLIRYLEQIYHKTISVNEINLIIMCPKWVLKVTSL